MAINNIKVTLVLVINQTKFYCQCSFITRKLHDSILHIKPMDSYAGTVYHVKVAV